MFTSFWMFLCMDLCAVFPPEVNCHINQLTHFFVFQCIFQCFFFPLQCTTPTLLLIWLYNISNGPFQKAPMISLPSQESRHMLSSFLMWRCLYRKGNGCISWFVSGKRPRDLSSNDQTQGRKAGISIWILPYLSTNQMTIFLFITLIN